jgi:predicted GIY-YIG superfamily endonuclease
MYFLLAADGRLLYVGQTTSLRQRLADHARSPRWTKVARARFEVADSQPAVLSHRPGFSTGL